jgi:hypothetical protein
MGSDLAVNNPLFEREEPSDPHIDSLGRSMGQRLTDFGVSGSKAENLHFNSYGSDATYAFNAWKNSPGHNTNMLNGTYTRIGIGRAYVSGKWYWVTDFANGTATAANNQCGTVTNPPPVSPPPTPKPPAPPPSEPPISITEPSPIATISPELISTNSASKSATPSVRIVKIGTESAGTKEPVTLVKGVAIGSLLLVNLALFSFLFWKFQHKFHS